MEVVEIPATVRLEAMLKKLHLHKPNHENCMVVQTKMVATVAFYSLSSHLAHPFVSPPSNHAASLEVTDNAIAI